MCNVFFIQQNLPYQYGYHKLVRDLGVGREPCRPRRILAGFSESMRVRRWKFT
jgi:hypothetical protein